MARRFVVALVLVAATGCGGGDAGHAPEVRAGADERVGTAGVTVALPSGWHTTTWDDGHVVDPLTRVVVASAPISQRGTGCQVARYTFADDAVALVVVEWEDPAVVRRPRPLRFTNATLPARPPPAVECFDGPAGTVQFHDGGRAFGAYLLVGREARPALVDEARGVLETLRVGERRLERNGVSLAVPPGWSGRILFREPTGRDAVIFQVASFELPPNAGLEPPPDLGPGEEDTIKAMGADDVLVTVADGEANGAPAPDRVTVAGLARVEGRRVPGGHSLARRSLCFGRRCVAIEVDFGAPAPHPALVARANTVLASLSVRE